MSIDFDNLPGCDEPGALHVSPYICQDPGGWTPPQEKPHGEVPVPGTVALVLVGIALMRFFARLS